MEVTKTTKVCGGEVLKCKHLSASTSTEMIFSVFVPPSAKLGPIPVIYYLSGLTCTDDNFTTKAGAQRVASEEGVMLVMPDTSPRGAGVDGEDESWDFGTGAGFYVDATTEKFKTNYNMYSYVTKELPALIEANFSVDGHKSIFGHSMGGHGALICALKNASEYASVSAFAPICNPINVPWGKKCFSGYLGEDTSAWSAYDATELLKANGAVEKFNIFVDQGMGDEFLVDDVNQLQCDAFESVCKEVGQKLTLKKRDGYDHSYYYIATYVDEHIKFHAKALRLAKKEAAEKAAADNASAVASFAETQGKPITCKASVAWAPNEELKVEEIIVDPPQAGEIRVKVIANALCHTDVYTLTGQDPEGLFPCILGHEAGAIVESVGAGVTSVQVGDHVVPCYTPQCNEPDCIFCMSSKTNLCPQIRSSQGSGLMPDGTSRFTSKRTGEKIFHFMGCSTFSEYTVIAAISAAKVSPAIPLHKACLLGCGVSTGLGAVWNTCKVTQGSSVAVFGLGAVGLSVIQAAKMSGASRIFAVDINPKKFEVAQALGATDCLNPLDYPGKKMQQVLAGELTKWGVDFTFDCTGNVEVMRSALESSHRGWGESCVIGVAASGKEICTRPFNLVIGRVWKGTAFGGWKSRDAVPKLVNRVLDGSLKIDHYITHTFDGVDKTKDAVHALHGGDCLRAVVKY